MYNAHGFTLASNCDSGGFLTITGRSNAENGALSAQEQHAGVANEIADMNFDAGEELVLKDTGDRSNAVALTYLSADGTSLSILYGDGDQDSFRQAPKGPATTDTQTTPALATCLVFGTRQLG